MELRDVICRLYRPPSRTLYLQTARHSSKVIPEEWRGKPVHQEKQMIVLESVYLLAERRRSVHYFNHKKKESLGRTHPTCSQLSVGQVMSWLYTQPCHMTRPHREGHSSHDSSAVNSSLLCGAPPAGSDNGVRLEPSVSE